MAIYLKYSGAWRDVKKVYLKDPGYLSGNSWTTAAEKIYVHDSGVWQQVYPQKGQAWLWGYGKEGELGNGKPNLSNSIQYLDAFLVQTPVTTFAGGNDWVEISCGGTNVAGIKSDGTLWTWGKSGYSLGINETSGDDRSTPVTTFAGGSDWKSVSVGARGVCAIRGSNNSAGSLYCWGLRYVTGQYYNYVSTNHPTPVAVGPFASTWKKVSVGLYGVHAIRSDGTMWSWGDYDNYAIAQFSDKKTPTGILNGGTDPWKDICTGRWMSVGIKEDGTLYTWGSCDAGGLGTPGNVLGYSYYPATTIIGGNNWTSASVRLGLSYSGISPFYEPSNLHHAVSAIKTDGSLWTWGWSDHNQLARINGVRTPVTMYSGGTNWGEVAQNASSNTQSGRDKFATNRFDRDHGQSSTTARLGPSAAVKTDGTLWTWGGTSAIATGQLTSFNYRESLPRIIYTPSNTPVTTIFGGTDWESVKTSRGATLTEFLNSGWGSVSHTVFGEGRSVDSGIVIARKTDGSLWSWGGRENIHMGRHDAMPFRSTPVTTFIGNTYWASPQAFGDFYGNDGDGAVYPNNDFATYYRQTVATNGVANMAIRGSGSSGNLVVWGDNERHELGITQKYSHITPQNIDNSSWTCVAMGNKTVYGSSSFGIKSDGTLWAWGVNYLSSLGTGLSGTYQSTPTQVHNGGNNWKHVTTHEGSTAAIKWDGTLWVWGNNGDYQLGIGGGYRSSVQTPVTTFAGGTNWSRVSVGEDVMAAIKTDGTLWVWGTASSGGNNIGNLRNRSSTPTTTFAGGTDWVDVKALNSGFLAIKSNGTMWMWGYMSTNSLTGQYFFNQWGYIPPGTSTIVSKNVPTQTNTSGWHHFIHGSWDFQGLIGGAIKTDGSLWLWGWRNDSGAMGDNGVIRYTANSFGNYSTIVPSYVATPIPVYSGPTNWACVCASTVYESGEHVGTVLGVTEDWYIDQYGFYDVSCDLWTFGHDRYGQLAIDRNTETTLGRINAPGETNTVWTDFDVGPNYAAAIKNDGSLWMWGTNHYGCLGQPQGYLNQNYELNDYMIRYVPSTTFAGGNDWKTVSCGHNAVIATRGNGKTPYIWGTLGYKTSGGSIVRSLSSYEEFGSTSSSSSGPIWPSGSTPYPGPTPVPMTAAAVGGSQSWKKFDWSGPEPYGLKYESSNSSRIYKMFGNGTTPTLWFAQNTVNFYGTRWSSLYERYFRLNETINENVSSQSLIAIDTSNRIWVNGENADYGQRGVNGLTDITNPVTIGIPSNTWTSISYGTDVGMARDSSGRLWTWGNDTNRHLGINEISSTDSYLSHPGTSYAAAVKGYQGASGIILDDGSSWESVTVGDWTIGGIKVDGTMWLWGDTTYNGTDYRGDLKFSQFGDGVTTAVDSGSIRPFPNTTYGGGSRWIKLDLRSDGIAAALKNPFG